MLNDVLDTVKNVSHQCLDNTWIEYCDAQRSSSRKIQTPVDYLKVIQFNTHKNGARREMKIKETTSATSGHNTGFKGGVPLGGCFYGSHPLSPDIVIVTTLVASCGPAAWIMPGWRGRAGVGRGRRCTPTTDIGCGSSWQTAGIVLWIAAQTARFCL